MLNLACVVLHTLMVLHGVRWVESTNQTTLEPPSTTNTAVGISSTTAHDCGNNTEHGNVTIQGASGYEVESTNQTATPEPPSTTNTTVGINSTTAFDGGNNTEHENVTILGASRYDGILGQRCFNNETEIETRIIGGQEAWAHSWPWQVVLKFAQMPACGGAIIDEQYVLTAAHCFKRYNKAKFWKVLAGKHDLGLLETTQQSVDVAEIMSHEGYNTRTKENDLAILRLRDKLTFNKYVRPIDLWMMPLEPPLMCTITGWGSTRENAPRVHRLQEVNVSCIASDVCNRYYRGRIKPTMVCAGNSQGGVDACQGDSGGPLSCFTGKKWQLAGVVSWGVGCGRARRPGVYTSLQHHVEWINEKLADGASGVGGRDSEATCGQVQRMGCHVQLALAQLIPSQGEAAGRGRVPVQLVGVTTACQYSWPWQVSLQTTDDGYNDCSGTLIHKDWVLASRHCYVSPTWTVVVLGVQSLNGMAFQSVMVDEVYGMPEGDDHSTGLLLIRLSRSARIGSAAIFPVCMADGVTQLDDSWSCVTTGWGRCRAAVDDVDPDTLHQAKLSLVDQAYCRRCWADDPRLQNTDLCADAAGSASCMGDPGAPLFCQKNGIYYLFGLFASGNRRCSPDKPAVFTSISAHRDWIQDIMSQYLSV